MVASDPRFDGACSRALGAQGIATSASLGSMLIASFTDQFTRLRDGDRFFYTGDPDLQTAAVTSIINLNTITLADIIRLNTGVTTIQNNVFITTMSADFNASNGVNAADLALWTSADPLALTADADHDGDSDGSDFLLWQQQFGAQALAAEAAAAHVPEPTTLALLSSLILMRRVRRQSPFLKGRG